ncbi:MAG: multiheme c-type cytochrome [Phycisphaeraceae bacterium]
MRADTQHFSVSVLFRSILRVMAVAAVAVAMIQSQPCARAQSLLDDEDVKKPAPKAGGGLLDDDDVKKPAPKAGGGLLDDDDVKKPAPKAGGGLLDDDDVKKPVTPPKTGGILLDDTDDAAQAPKPKPPAPKEEPKDEPKEKPVEDPHAKLYAEDRFPSASKCAGCHAKIYEEWRVSNHAYASISPVFHKFEQKINDLSQGTIGYFCMRCHSTIGTIMKEPREMPLWERSQVSREGVTCVTCHRVSQPYFKVNGERIIEEGDIHARVKGSSDGTTLAKLLEDMTILDPKGDKPGQTMKIHAKAVKFEQISKSEFCVSCHQVAVNVGIKLEVVWDQYRDSPAFRKGNTCQDCHMGKVPGVAAGYEMLPAAEVAGRKTPVRKHSNHSFYGPGYPIAHPGVFPHNAKAETMATMEEWLAFDYRAGWGSEDFEDKVDKGEIKVTFPKKWSDPFVREDAFGIIQENIAKLNEKKKHRLQVMENGSRIDGPYFSSAPRAGKSMSFHYTVTNTDDGHNLPSGSLGAQPEIWLNVALIDPDGKNVWESGYVDSIGDMADLHSVDVRKGKLAHDGQLFNLQSKFLTTNVKGTEREMSLPINVDIDQLPFLRPAPQPTTVLNHTPFVRMEARSLPPLGSRKAKYSVPSSAMTKPGKYKLAVRLRSRAEPIYFMRFIGATKEMEQAMNEWMIDIHPYAVEFEVK